ARLYDDDGSVVEQLGKVQREAEGWKELDPALADVARRLEGLSAEAQDLADTLRHLAEGYAADPARREEAEGRLRLLRRLEAKYGRGVDDLLAYHATLDEQEKALQQQEDDRTQLEASLAEAFDKLRQAGAELSRQRQRVAKKLAAEVQRELADL